MIGAVITGLVTVGKAIVAALPVIAREIGIFLSKPENIKFMAEVVVSMANISGALKSNEKPEDLGEKVLKANEEGIKMEDYDSFDEYKKALDDFDVSTCEKEFSEEEKLIAGLSTLIHQVSEIYGTDIVPLLNTVNRNPDKYDVDKIRSYIEIFRENNVDMGKIEQFYNGQMSKSERNEFSKLMVQSELKGGVETVDEAKDIIASQKF